jgi:hypothetical protein
MIHVPENKLVGEALNLLEEISSSFRVLGTYPRHTNWEEGS